jgi:hypothetical protein
MDVGDNCGVGTVTRNDPRQEPTEHRKAGLTLAKLYLTEYERLKEEQLRRLGFRDNLLYATIATLGGVMFFVFGLPHHEAALLLVPVIVLVLGWTYLVNDEKVSAIGRYIRLTLAPHLAEMIGPDEATVDDRDRVFGWEVAHRSDQRRGSRKYLQLAVDLLTFCVPGIVAVALYLVIDRPTAATGIVSGIDLLAMVLLGYEIVAYADLKRGR